LLAKARNSAPTPRVMVKSVKLEWMLGRLDMALALIEQGIKDFSTFAKLWMMKGQIFEQKGNLSLALETYQMGVKTCPSSVALWLLFARLQEKATTVIKARSVLEKAKLRNPRNELVWLEAIRVEVRAGLKDIALSMMARALQECPKSGVLWAEAIFMESRPLRKTKSIDALKKCEHDANVLLAVSKLLWTQRKMDKCRDWFNRTVKIDNDLGDAWVYFYKFETVHGSKESQMDIVKRCVEAEPHHGELWTNISKQVDNWKKNTEDILYLAAQSVQIPT